MRVVTGLVVGVVCGLVCTMAQAAEPAQRTLSFEDRVKAQRAIDRVYYTHQLGATKTFDEAVRTSVLEAKVRKYLDQTAALNSYWKTAVTDKTLQRELERMAQGTKMPERLLELYAALGNDPFLIKECLARPALVDRLTHNFYAFDPTQHVKAKAHADAIHSQLESGALSPSADHPNRTVSELVVSETETGLAPAEPSAQRKLTAEEFKTRRAELPVRPGKLSEIKETRDAFVFNLVLSETTTSARVASYLIAKTTWDAWWVMARGTVRGDAVTAVATGATGATGAVDLPMPTQARETSPTTTCADDGWDNGSLGGVPEQRARHTAVWTGNEMLIWGGNGEPVSYFLGINTGGRYDPTTDTWASISATNAPSGRARHTAVWAGNRMVVWGGIWSLGNPVGFDSGGSYDPETDSWTPTSTTGAPSGRSGHTAVWTGSLMVVWGGNSTSDSSPLGTGGSYDPASDSWAPTSMANAPSARNLHTAVWTGNRMVVWGGNPSGFYRSVLSSGGNYDPATDVWTPTSMVDAPAARSGHTAVWTGAMMIVWGGRSVVGVFDGAPYLDQTDTGGRYDPSTDTWAATSAVNAPTPRRDYSAVSTGTGMIVWGGFGAYFPNFGDLKTGARYDPATDVWTTTATVGAPDPRDAHTAVWTGDLMVVWGGGGAFQAGFDTGGRYDPATNSWTPTTVTNGGPSARVGHKAVWTGSLMLVWGGSAVGYWPFQYLDTGARYDPTTDSWTPTATTGAPSVREGETAVWTGSVMVVWGGFIAEQGYLDTAGRYDPVADSWTPASMLDAPSLRYRHTALWTGSVMVVWGGYGQGGTNGYLDTGGRYDPATDSWTPTSMTAAPTRRMAHAAVWTGSAVVVWGGNVHDGSQTVFRGTGGRYDPASDAWTPVSTVGAPSPRAGPLSVWTGSRMVAWGGFCASGTSGCDVGGQYDPVADSWTSMSTAGAPPSGDHTAVWTGQLMVVWGHSNLGGSRYFNTGRRYEPSANSWRSLPSAAEPKPRGGHTAVWTGNLMVVWGGLSRSSIVFSNGGRYSVGSLTDDDCDGDGFTIAAGDCDDHAPSSFPGAPQLCDGRNNDCADPAWPAVPADEADGDGDRFHLCHADCDDAKATVYPGAPQLCDGLNNDCDDPAWPTPAANEVDVDGDLARICHGDCDDANWTSGPGAWEYCDGVDNDCNGVADDGPVLQNCDDSNLCTDDSCGGAAGCINHANSSPCDDANECTLDDVCGAGQCHGAPLNGTTCSDGDACTENNTCVDGYCNDGTEVTCDDNNPCNGYEYCSHVNGCFATPPPDCTDYNPCTDDSCDPATGCFSIANAKACDDGSVCTSGDVCGNSTCRGTPTSGNACSDYNRCTTDDTCVNGQCRGGALLECDDGDPCNGVEYCAYYAGCIAGTPIYCDDGNTCTDDACEQGTGCVFTANANACDDANTCTSDDVCGSGQCRGTPSTGLACDDFNTCTVNEACGADGACHPGALVDCNDGNPCNGTEVCYPYFGCYSGQPLNCGDGNICTTDSCDSVRGCVHADAAGPCNDGSACTLGDTCGGGTCSGTAVVCNDNNACTTDTCSPSTGCVFTSGTVACGDNNPCTDDTCDPATGLCRNADNDANACSDGDACTQTDHCLAGACTGSNPLECGTGCPAGFDPVGTLCQKTYDIDVDLLDNQNAYCFGTGENRYNDCNGLNYGFHWLDLGWSLAAVTRVDVRFESGLNCGGTASSVTLNGAPAGNFNLLGNCDCNPEHGTISLPNLDAGVYSMAGVNAISIAPHGECEGLSRSEVLHNYFARVTVTYAPVSVACRVGACDPGTGACAVSDLPDGAECADDNPCTAGDTCRSGICSGTAMDCDDDNPCTDDSCDPATGCAHINNANACDDGNACTTGDICGGGACRGDGAVLCDDGIACNGGEHCDPAIGCVAGTALVCNDNNLCTTDTCNPATGCVVTNNANACDDGNACTTGDSCGGGACIGGAPLACNDNNLCTTDTCNTATGCVFTNNANACDDGNACTRTDACSAGACLGGNPVSCAALDQCHDAGVCNPGTGACSNPNKPSGTICDDSSLCTTGETCQSGTCTPAFSGLNHPAPKSAGYYKKLCEKREHNQLPYQGDQLTEADAACVGQLTSTFAGISTIDDICGVIDSERRPPHGGRHHGGPGDGPDGKDCDKGENELIATALNICRARVCEAQQLDSRCHGNSHTTVSQSFADADAILDDAARNKDTCKNARCELREINNGHALEMNSLTLLRESNKVRLTWLSPVLDDGSGAPSSYELWRRPMGSNDAFVKIGTTAASTYLDATAGTAAWEYGVTAVIPGN